MNPSGQAVLVTFDKTKVTRRFLSRRNVTEDICYFLRKKPKEGIVCIESCILRIDIEEMAIDYL